MLLYDIMRKRLEKSINSEQKLSTRPRNLDFPFAASEVVIQANFCTRFKPNDHAADNVAVWTPKRGERYDPSIS
ncbi:MAG: hypothetical protein IH987_18640 [Planctomycetes bacterium]|nr:hypothetical protein [Planctomycetota bacterium]